MRGFADHWAFGLGLAMAISSGGLAMLRMMRLVPQRLSDSRLWVAAVTVATIGFAVDVTLRLVFAG